MRSLLRLWPVLLSALAVTGSLRAQSGVSIRSGQSIEGTLSTRDPVSTMGTNEDRFSFRGEAGQHAVISLTSGDFDAYLILVSPSGAQEVNDDAAAGSSDARIETDLRESGIYTISATTFVPGQTGRYTLALEITGGEPPAPSPPPPAAPSPPAAPRPTAGGTPISFGQTVQGALEDSDQTSSTGQHEDVYEFQGRAGQSVTVAMNSRDIDSTLHLVAPSGQALIDDDSGPGADALIQTTLTESGVFQVIATSYRAGTGSYSLSLAEGGQQAVPAHSSALVMGQTVNGSLAPGDEVLPSGEYCDRYTFNGTPGQAVAFEMDSGAVDPYLVLIAPSGLQIDDDDSGGGANARIGLTLTEAGAHQVIASSFAAGEAGPYTLTVTGGQPGAPPAAAFPPPIAGAAPVAIGQQVFGALGPGDEQRATGEFMDRYQIQGQPGDTVEIRMESDALDPYLYVVAPSGAVDQDDDGGGGLNARLFATLSESGPYQVIATSLGSGAAGPYTLTIRPRDLSQNSPGGPLNVGQTVNGFLGPGDRQMGRGEYCDEYRVDVTAGQRLAIRLNSDEFDPYLIYVDPSGAQQDNDDLLGLNAGLDVVVTAPGTARIGATSLSRGEMGAYALSVQEAEGAPGASPMPTLARPAERIIRNNPIVGTLGPGDTSIEGAWADAYGFLGRAGDTVILTMESTQFTPQVALRDPRGVQTNGTASEDGRSSTITTTLPSDGQYVIFCTTADASQRGNYTVTLR